MLIATDLDEVLAGYLDAFLEFHNKVYKTSFSKNHLLKNNLLELCGKTKNESIEKLYCFYKTKYFNNIKPITGAINGINSLKKNNELIIITARQLEFAEKTNEWVEKYFPNTFKEIHFTNSNSKKGHMITKAEICCNKEVSVLIEDRIEYAIDCSYNGNKVLLLNYPWNQGKLTKKITRVQNWSEIVEKIKNIN